MRGRTLTNLALVGAFAVVCLGGLLYLSYSIGLRLPGQTGYEVRVSFSDAAGLVPQDEVRVAGVKVGRVLSVSADSAGGTEVVMQVDAMRLRSDTRAVLRPKSLLGTKYIELVRRPQSSAPYLGSGAAIPRSQTGEAVEIDDVLNNMDAPTRAAMSESLRQLGVALDGRSGDVNTTIPQVEALTAQLRPIAQIGERRDAELSRILVDLNTIFQALADEQDSLGRVIDSGNQVFGAVAARDQELGVAIAQTANLFQSLDQSFAGTTDVNRQSLAAAPESIATTSHTIGLTNPEVDQLIPEILLGQVNYPSDQLSLGNPESIALTREWISAFSQRDVNGNSFRITNINPNPNVTLTPGGVPALPAPPGGSGLPTPPLPVPTPSGDPLCLLIGVRC